MVASTLSVVVLCTYMYLLPDAVRDQMPVSRRRNPWSVLIDWTSASPGLGAGEGEVEVVWPEVMHGY